MDSTKDKIKRLSRLSANDIGKKEENVKYKFVIPLLEYLGHQKSQLDLEYAAGRKEIDIFIKDLPEDCNVIIDTKNYDESLDAHLEQIGKYANAVGALLALIINGEEIRIYDPDFRGVSFESSLLYLIRRKELMENEVIDLLYNFLSRQNLLSRKVKDFINEREEEIKTARTHVEKIKDEFRQKCSALHEKKQQSRQKLEEINKRIRDLDNQRKIARENRDAAIRKVKESHRLPLLIGLTETNYADTIKTHRKKARKVRLQELVDKGLVRDGETFYLCYGSRTFTGEEVEIVASRNELKYKKDGGLYTKTKLACKLLKKYGIIQTDAVQGPKCWKSVDGKTLLDLENEIRNTHST